MTFYISPPPRNPLSAIITGIVGVLLLAGAFMLGLVALVVALGLGLVVWLGVYARIWWIRRKLAKQGGGPTGVTEGQDLEVEYTVISRQREE